MSDSDGESRPGRGKVVQRHKKELKNLQDECKKEAKRCKAKADKRTVEEKYAQLEKELLEKHKEELSVYDTDAVPEVDGLAEAAAQVDGGLYSKQTDEPKELTKGQKKKQAKRAKEEEERKARQSDYDGQTKYSEIESAAIARQLAEAGLKIWEVPSDGDCLFHSLAHQLKLADSKNPISNQELRVMCADFMLKNADDFRPFLEDVESDESWVAYCEKVRTSEWGTNVEVEALSRALARPIWIYQGADDGMPIIKIGEHQPYGGDTPLRVTYHKFLYSVPHYNSLEPVN
jgi:OTU domain-containing protein 6